MQYNTKMAMLPLITKQAVSEIGLSALPQSPPDYCRIWEFLHDEETPDQSVAVMAVGNKYPITFSCSAYEAAFISEVTRVGITLVSNRNTPSAVQATTAYIKLRFPGAPKDNLPLQRLLGDAQAHEEVSRDQVIPSDLRGATLRKSASGKASKGAWVTTRAHCEANFQRWWADQQMTPPFSLEEYMANLDELFLACQAQVLPVDTGNPL